MIFLAKALRIAAFLVLAVVMGFGGAMLTGMAGPPATNYGWFGLLVGVVLAWPVSGIPLYIRRHQARSTSMEMALR